MDEPNHGASFFLSLSGTHSSTAFGFDKAKPMQIFRVQKPQKWICAELIYIKFPTLMHLYTNTDGVLWWMLLGG